MLFFLRILGGWSILTAVIALVNDLTHSYETGAKFTFASLGKDWSVVSPSTLTALQTGIEQHVSAKLWDPVLLAFLRLPGFAVFAVIGILFYAAGLRRRRQNIYAN